MVRYYITHDDLSGVVGSTVHTDFACAWTEACRLAREQEAHLWIVSSNGKQSWEVYSDSDGTIVPMPTESHEVWDDTYLEKCTPTQEEIATYFANVKRMDEEN